MYSDGFKAKVIGYVRRGHSVREARRRYPGPSGVTVYLWLGHRPPHATARVPATRLNASGVTRAFTPDPEVRQRIVLRRPERGERVPDVAFGTGYGMTAIYNWIRRCKRSHPEGPMAGNKRSEGHDSSGGRLVKVDADRAHERVTLDAKDNDDADPRMQVDILKEAPGPVRKDHGVDPAGLSNFEKHLLVNALRQRRPVRSLCPRLALPRSSYYFHRFRRPTGLAPARARVRAGQRLQTAFEDNYRAYEYRRLQAAPHAMGVVASQGLVRSLMHELGITVRSRRRREYGSYHGEITPAPVNLLERDFHADAPGAKLLTDITGFALPAGKLHLSPVVDCHDGKILTYTIGEHPDASLVNRMPDRPFPPRNRPQAGHPLLRPVVPLPLAGPEPTHEQSQVDPLHEP